MAEIICGGMKTSESEFQIVPATSTHPAAQLTAACGPCAPGSPGPRGAVPGQRAYTSVGQEARQTYAIRVVRVTDEAGYQL